MDLSQLDAPATEQGVAMTVDHPTKPEPLLKADGAPMTITLVGKDSDRFRKATRAALNRRLASRKIKVKAEDLEAENLEGLVACTIAWDGIMVDGAALDCTPVNVRAVYTRFPFIREQVAEFVEERANFFREPV
jgi:hypothetical protein